MIDYVTHTSNKDLEWDAQLVVTNNIEKPSDKLLGNDWYRNGKAIYEKGYATDLLRDEAIRVIKERDQSKPLFLYVPFTAPHTPLQAKDSDLEKYKNLEVEIPGIFKRARYPNSLALLLGGEGLPLMTSSRARRQPFFLS